jgi:hypothetical protein
MDAASLDVIKFLTSGGDNSATSKQIIFFEAANVLISSDEKTRQEFFDARNATKKLNKS